MLIQFDEELIGADMDEAHALWLLKWFRAHESDLLYEDKEGNPLKPGDVEFRYGPNEFDTPFMDSFSWARGIQALVDHINRGEPHE